MSLRNRLFFGDQLLWLRRLPAYPRRLMPVAALLTAMAGAIRIVQRW